MKFKTAKCNRTGIQTPLSDGFFVADIDAGEWQFVGQNVPEKSGSEYSIAVSRIVSSPEAFVDWMGHLNEKSWFDAEKFADFFTRLRKENNLFGSI